MDFSKEYTRSDFVLFVRNFLTERFVPEQQDVTGDIKIHYKLQKTKTVSFLGSDPSLDMGVFEIEHESEFDPRVTLSRESFRAVSAFGFTKGLCAFTSKKSKNWRLSLVTMESKIHAEKGKIIKEYSNPRRLSFFLGQSAKTATPKKFLEKRVADYRDLLSRFSIEVVNKTFYNEIARKFTELSGGDRHIGSEAIHAKAALKLPSTKNRESYQQFGVRLIGRLVFCWFLKKKGLISEEVLNSKDVNDNYYHRVLEPLFFQVLNKPFKERDKLYQQAPWRLIPFLNGGLFEAKSSDYYIFDKGTGLSKNINILTVPDKWLKSFIEILETYNFTIDENNPIDIDLSIDPEMLGRIFENLLAELNPETGETARKETGSFYTPRQIVDYMVSAGIKLYLKQKTGIDDKTLDLLLDYDYPENPLDKGQSENVIDALHVLKILDPACGSGAFPMGILQHVLLILSKVDPDSNKWLEKRLEGIDDPMLQDQIRKNLEAKNVDYIHKLGIIRETVYGADIQPIAVEIARLRVFLSLIVDEDVHEHENNRGIEPLPNLEFKFVTADTLTRLPGQKKGDNFSLGEDTHYLPRMRNLIRRYFGCADLKQKEQIKADFIEMQTRVFNKRLGLFSQNTQTAAISIWKPFSEDTAAWFDESWMFGIDNGFDIVIANPPYIQLQKIKEISERLKKQGYKTYAATGDIYALFYERGLELLAKDGVLTYISSNKWMRAAYGKTLRNLFLKQTDMHTLIDFGDQQLFSNATTYTNIMVLKPKGKKNTKTCVCDLSRTLNPEISIRDNLNINSGYLGEFDEERFLIVRKAEYNLKKKIEEKGVPLKEWDVEINYGIKTGLNEAFIIDNATKERLCREDKKSAQIIKPILRGKDIKRYQAQWAGLWLINSHNGYVDKNGKKVAAVNVQKDYPAVYRHLDEVGKKIERGEIKAKGKGLYNRDDQGQHWSNLRDCAYVGEFEKEKVIIRAMMEHPSYIFDTEGFYGNDKTTIITGHSLRYLCALMNSRVLWHYIAQMASSKSGGFYEIKPMYIQELPIPQIPQSKQKPFEKMVDKIQAFKAEGKDTGNLEAQVDRMVYELYGLKDDEIALVEKHTG